MAGPATRPATGTADRCTVPCEDVPVLLVLAVVAALAARRCRGVRGWLLAGGAFRRRRAAAGADRSRTGTHAGLSAPGARRAGVRVVVVVDRDERAVLVNPVGPRAWASRRRPAGRSPSCVELAAGSDSTRRRVRQRRSTCRSAGLGREPIALSVRAVPLPGHGRARRSVVLLFADVSEQRRLEAVRRDFVANVSHELKTPVGALTLLAEAVQDAADDPEAVARFAGRMQREGSRLGRLVQELIELSRVQGAEPLPGADAGRGRAACVERGGRPQPAARPSRPASRSPCGAPSRPRRAGQRDAADHGDRATWSTTPSPTARPRTRVGVTARRRGPIRRPADGSTSRSPTRASASPRPTWTGSSSASTGSTRPAPGPPAAPGSAWPSSSTSPPTTAAG